MRGEDPFARAFVFALFERMSLAAVFQIGSLGDSVVSLPSLRSIPDILPDCSEYILLTQSEENGKIAPTDVFDMSWKPIRRTAYRARVPVIRRSCSALSLLGRLRYYRPKYAVYLMPAERSAQDIERDRLFFRAAGIRQLIGFRLPFSHTDLPPISASGICRTEAYMRFRRLWNEAAEEKYAAYAKPPLLHPRPEAAQRIAEWLQSTRRTRERPLVAFSPYSNSLSKDLSQDTVVQLLQRLEFALGVEVVVVGGSKDFPRAQSAVMAARAGLNTCGMFSLEESAALIQSCRLAVCVDSGPMHLAGALGIPCVIVFSRTNTQLGRWFPLGERHTILYRNVECAGCRLTKCKFENHPCMVDVTADQISAAVKNALNGAKRIPEIGVNGTEMLFWPSGEQA